MSEERNVELMRNTAEIVAAFLSRTEVAIQDLPTVIDAVQTALSRVGETAEEESAVDGEWDYGLASPGEPAVPIEESIQPDYIVCLEDGKKLSMLKRHLRTAYGLTPDQYRARWGLSADYPMTAPAYSERRSALARENGLGHNREQDA